MKIAFIERDLSRRSGSRRFIYEATNRLEALTHKVRIFTTRLNKKTCFPEYLSLPVRVVPVEEFQSSAGRFLERTLHRDLEYYWSETQAILEISRMVADWDPDIAIFHYAGEHWLQPYFYYLKEPVGAVCLHVTPPTEGPLALPFQELTWRTKLEDKVLDLPPIKKWNAVSFKNLQLIIAHSRYLLMQAEKLGVIGSRRSAIIPLGVNHSRFYPTSEEEPFALFLGRIDPQKSIELAVYAMKNTDSDKSLIIAGDMDNRYAWYKEKLENIAKKIGVSDRVKIVLSPAQDQLVRLLQRCSVFLFPSMIDTFGVVVLEAMACGKPVIACGRGGIPELLDDCGFLLEPDVNQWQETVKKVFSNTDLRLDIGRKAFERSKLYSWENAINSLLQAIEKFIPKMQRR